MKRQSKILIVTINNEMPSAQTFIKKWRKVITLHKSVWKRCIEKGWVDSLQLQCDHSQVLAPTAYTVQPRQCPCSHTIFSWCQAVFLGPQKNSLRAVQFFNWVFTWKGPVSEYLVKSLHQRKNGVLLTPVCAEMRGYDSDSSNLSCSTCRINSGLSASTTFRAFILNVLLLRKWILVSEIGKGGERRFKWCAYPHTVPLWPLLCGMQYT